MNQPLSSTDTADSNIRHLIIFGVILGATIIAIRSLGRIFWCEYGGWSPWSWDIWSTHNSQYLIDPYFFSHVLHGFLLYGALHLCWKSGPLAWKLQIAVLIEAGWELLENLPIIINRYRENTMAQDYFGDSIANSTFDIFACTLEFCLAGRMKVLHSAVLCLLIEIGMTFAIRDCLLLNILMLVYPVNAIREWQAG